MRWIRLFLPLAVLLSAAAGAQRPLTQLLPASTLLAVEVNSVNLDRSALAALFAGLDFGPALTVAAPLKELLGADHGSGALWAPEQCAPFLDGAKAVRGGDFMAAAGLSLPSVGAEPQLLLLVQPGSRAQAAQLLADAVACLDGRRYAQQDADAIYALQVAGGTAYAAVHQNVLALASDSDLLRGALRLAAGSPEASLADAAAAQRSADAGLKLTINPRPLQKQLRALAAVAPDAQRTLAARVVATAETVSGYSLALTLTADALTVTSALEVAEGSSEAELVALLTCSECRLTGTPRLPAGAVVRSANALPLRAAVQWADSWLADLARAGEVDAGAASVRGAAWRYLGVDLGALLLDWYEGAAYSTVLGVLDTDLTNWVMGPPMVTVMPVLSEEAAWRAVQQWVELARQAADAAAGPAHGQGIAPSFKATDALAVQQLAHDGVKVLRVRFGPVTDVGFAVYDDQLVMGSPTAVLLTAIDQRDAATDARGPVAAALGQLQQQPGVTRYSAVDTAAFLLGISQLAELGAGAAATAMVGAVHAAQDGQFGYGVARDARALTEFTFQDALTVADTAVSALRQLAQHLGVLTSSSSVQDGAVVTTWRLPLLR